MKRRRNSNGVAEFVAPVPVPETWKSGVDITDGVTEHFRQLVLFHLGRVQARTGISEGPNDGASVQAVQYGLSGLPALDRAAERTDRSGGCKIEPDGHRVGQATNVAQHGPSNMLKINKNLRRRAVEFC
jgi:hypothetical protein